VKNPAKLPDLLVTLLLPVAALTIALFVAEIIFRIAGYGNAVRYKYVSELGWVHRPNQHATTVGQKAVRINSLGLRGPDVVAAKAPGIFRVLLLGDSFTFGYGVDDDSTYGVQLERLFRARGAECDQIQVLNGGVNGYNTSQEISFLRRVGLTLEPDLVVLGFTPNDIMTQTEAKAMLQWPLLKEWLARSALYQFVAPRLKAILFRRAGRAYEDTLALFVHDDSLLNSRAEILRTELAEVRQLGTRYNFQSVVVVFPFAGQAYALQPGDWPPRVIREATSQNQLPLLDLLPAFHDAVHHGEAAFLDEPTQHPNGYGHQIAAANLYAFLRDHRLVPACSLDHRVEVQSGMAQVTP
jgi:lysophospholipase L1-like esterase